MVEEASGDPVRTVRPTALVGTLEAAEEALLVPAPPVAQASRSLSQAENRS